jgi:hypothetical protein
MKTCVRLAPMPMATLLGCAFRITKVLAGRTIARAQ